METMVIYSSFFLTLLMLIGLFFFIRASVKERIEQITLVAESSEDAILEQISNYFSQRAYKVQAIDPRENQVNFTGLVRPSWFLAIFLTLLAAIGLVCLGLTLSYLSSAVTPWIPWFSLLGLGAGFFYWKQAQRVEKVSLKVESSDSGTLLTVIGHRDELKQLQKELLLKPV
ncbi:MAG: hypothetical protein RLZZ148_713 [Cyanobacteriota bacterium]